MLLIRKVICCSLVFVCFLAELLQPFSNICTKEMLENKQKLHSFEVLLIQES